MVISILSPKLKGLHTQGSRCTPQGSKRGEKISKKLSCLMSYENGMGLMVEEHAKQSTLLTL